MAGFASLFEKDDDQVVVMRSHNQHGDECVVFSTQVEGLGTRCYHTIFAQNETAAEDADLFFKAVTEEYAFARAELIRQNWADSDLTDTPNVPEPPEPDAHEQ